MCWVIPPASVSTTAALRIASSRVVLPWSTWPMIVTTGGRADRSASASSMISGSLVVGRVLDRHLALDLGGDQHDLVIGEGLGRRAHLPEAHQRLDDLRHRDPESGRKILDRDPGLDRDGPRRWRRSGSARRSGGGAVARGARVAAPGGAALDHHPAATAPRATPAWADRAVRSVGSVSHWAPQCKGERAPARRRLRSATHVRRRGVTRRARSTARRGRCTHRDRGAYARSSGHPPWQRSAGGRPWVRDGHSRRMS